MEEHAPTTVYRIASRTEWADAQRSGELRPERFEEEGFVHLSKLDQILRPANLLYRGQSDLVLLVIRVDRLTADLVYEPGSHGEEENFPHLYGPLNVDAVDGTIDFPGESDGSFVLPQELASPRS